MSRTILLIASLVCAVLLFGCSTSENNSNMTANTSEKPATATPAAATASSTGDKIGVPECDEYIAKYEACTSKVPEAARAAYKSALEQVRSQWKTWAANPQTKATLAAACKQATEQQAAAWKMYGCAN